MSLINDALKRAKAAQDNTPPPQMGLPLRAAEPNQAFRHGMGYAMPAGLALLALLVLFFAWRLTRRETPNAEVKSVASIASSEAAEVVPAHGDLAVRARTSDSASISNKALTPVPAGPQNTTGIAPAPAPETTTTNLIATALASTNTPSPEPPKPMVLKLQGITFQPNHPSALINGRTLFIGDHFQSQRVVKISKDSVTLIGNGATNVLTLQE